MEAQTALLIEQAKKKALQDISFLKTHVGYVRAGYPHYFCPFGRDGLIIAWQMLPFDPSIAKATLAFCADTQAKEANWKRDAYPGGIFHEYRIFNDPSHEIPTDLCTNDHGYPHHHPWDVEFPYHGTIDATPLFIFLASEYLRATRDMGFIKEIWPNIFLAYEWIKMYGDKDSDGFVEYERQNPNGLYHQAWRDGMGDHLKIEAPVAMVEVQGYAYAAYQAMREIIISSNEQLKFDRTNALLVSLNERAQSLRHKLLSQFEWQEEGFFYLALDGKKKQKKSVASNQGHLLFPGILHVDEARKVIGRLMRPDIFTPCGIRTISDEDARFGEHGFDPSSYHLGSIWPHDNWIIYEGCKRNGFIEEARAIKKAMLSMFEKLGCIPELFGYEDTGPYLIKVGERGCTYTANLIQGWSAAGIYNMMSDSVEI